MFASTGPTEQIRRQIMSYLIEAFVVPASEVALFIEKRNRMPLAFLIDEL
jgi:hypothetical protein